MYRLRVLNQVRMAYLPAVAVGASASAAVAVSSLINSVSAAKPPPPPPPTDCDLDKKLIRAKDLSIYVTPAPATEENPLCKKKAAKEDPDDRLMDLVRATRKELWRAKEEFDKEVENLGKQVEEILQTGKSHMDSSLQTLRDPENATYRYAAIAGGGLFGLILSLRRGIFRKLTYTSTGALAMAALCYPEEAQEISEEVYSLLVEYSNIAYHFANAAIKDLAGVELTVPSLEKINIIGQVSEWFDKKTNDVSKTSPSGSALLPPATETPSHVIPLASTNSGNFPMPPMDAPLSMPFNKNNQSRDQSNPADKDMYSLRV